MAQFIPHGAISSSVNVISFFIIYHVPFETHSGGHKARLVFAVVLNAQVMPRRKVTPSRWLMS
jgi:hypothetical protein